MQSTLNTQSPANRTSAYSFVSFGGFQVEQCSYMHTHTHSCISLCAIRRRDQKGPYMVPQPSAVSQKI